MKSRDIKMILPGQRTQDGAGVSLARSIGSHRLDHLDPFLLLDEIYSDQAGDYIAGFPPHPHRGIETVTYLMAGAMAHEDSAGNKGELSSGDVQWMTAGKGIIHSEMPKQKEGLLHGFQLWINLPAKDKLCAPRYQEIPSSKIPEIHGSEGMVRVIAGRYQGAEGPIQDLYVQPLYLDVHLKPGQSLDVPLEEEHNAFAYLYQGQMDLGEEAPNMLERGHLVVFGPGDQVHLMAGEAETRLILVAGKPLREAIVRYGPFVMNSREQIVQAFEEYQQGTFLD